MIQDKKPFCWAPWVSLTYNAIRHGGSAEPCCEWRGNQTSPKNFFQGSATEYLKSDWLKNIKQVMLNHDMTVISKTCEECIIEESVGNNSSRMDYHNNIKNGEIFNLKRNTKIQDGKCIVGIRPEDIVLSNDHSENSIEVEFRTKTPLNLRIVFLVRLKNGLELLCSTTEEESHLIDENKKMYISFIEEKSHFFDIETKRNLE